jgi:hypothetical protein
MANTYKNIIITPNRDTAANVVPSVQFSGGDGTSNTDIYLRVFTTSNGTLLFESSANQLFSITNELSNSIFSVNDVSGIPSLDIYANGNIFLAPYIGNVAFGMTSAPTSKLHVLGNANITSSLIVQGTDVIQAIAAGNAYATAVGTSANARAVTIATPAFNQANIANAVAVYAANFANAINVIATNAFNEANTKTSIIAVGNTAPTNTSLWFHSELGKLFINYTDSNSTQWIDTNRNKFFPISIDVTSDLRTINTNTSVLSTDSFILANGTITLTLPATSTVSGKQYKIKNIGTDDVIIVPQTGEQIDGKANIIIGEQYSALTLLSTGSTWHIF